jgi:twitching motility protein PilI
MSADLRALRDDPFALLLALEQRLRSVRLDAAVAGVTETWQGLAYRIGDRWLVSPKGDVREVIPPPKITHVPNARPWLTGVANARGSLLTLVDLKLLTGGTHQSGDSRSARVLVLNSDSVPAGFVVDEVAGYRQFTVVDQAKPNVADDDPLEPYLLGAFAREGRSWLVLSLHKLANAESLRRAGW